MCWAHGLAVLALANPTFRIAHGARDRVRPLPRRFFMFSVALSAAMRVSCCATGWLAWGVVSIASVRSSSPSCTLPRSLPASACSASLVPKGLGQAPSGRRRGLDRATPPRSSASSRTSLPREASASGSRTTTGCIRTSCEFERKVFFVPVGARLDGLDWLVLPAGRVETPGAGRSIAPDEDGCASTVAPPTSGRASPSKLLQRRTEATPVPTRTATRRDRGTARAEPSVDEDRAGEGARVTDPSQPDARRARNRARVAPRPSRRSSKVEMPETASVTYLHRSHASAREENR